MTQSILIKPLVTEKSTKSAGANVYVFQVALSASKHQIQQCVESMYGVEVASVRTITRKGKEKRVGRKGMITRLSDTKIGYIIVSKGTIDFIPHA